MNTVDWVSLGAGLLVLIGTIVGLKDAHKKGEDGSGGSKWMASFAGAALFLILSSPILYHYTDMAFRKVGGEKVALVKDGCPTALGIGVHSAVYLLLGRAIMG